MEEAGVQGWRRVWDSEDVSPNWLQIVENTRSTSLTLLFHRFFISASRRHRHRHHHCHNNCDTINVYLYLSPYHLFHHYHPRFVCIIMLLALSRRREHERWPTDTRLTSHSDETSDWSHLLLEEAVTGRGKSSHKISVRNSPPSFSFLCSPPSVFLCFCFSVSHFLSHCVELSLLGDGGRARSV